MQMAKHCVSGGVLSAAGGLSVLGFCQRLGGRKLRDWKRQLEFWIVESPLEYAPRFLRDWKTESHGGIRAYIVSPILSQRIDRRLILCYDERK